MYESSFVKDEPSLQHIWSEQIFFYNLSTGIPSPSIGAHHIYEKLVNITLKFVCFHSDLQMHKISFYVIPTS